MNRSHLVVLILFIYLTHTSKPCNAQNHTFQTYTEDGITIAETTGSPKYTGELFQYDHVLTLEQNVDIIESLISSIMGFARTENGEFVVVDNKWAGGSFSTARLVVFSEDGRFTRSIGRAGSGPGEFQSMSLQSVSDSLIGVYDSRLRRLTHFSPNGDLLEMMPVPLGIEHRFSQIYAIGTDKILTLRVDPTNVEYWITDSEGTVLHNHRTPEIEATVLVDLGGSRPMPSAFPYHPVPSAFYSPAAGVAMTDGINPVIEIFNLDGRLRRRIRVADLHLDITRLDIERFNNLWENRLANMPDPAQPQARKQRNSLRESMPDMRPPWTYIASDDAGYWWLRIQNSPDPWIEEDQSYSYRILSPDGEYLGDTTAPPTLIRSTGLAKTYPISVCGSFFLTMENDPDTGEQLLNVYQIRSIVSGFKYP